MTDLELLVDWIGLLAEQLHGEIEGLVPEALAWQPDAAANSIGVTVWHVARWLDVLVVQVLAARPAEDEFWHTSGWAARTGYDPCGHGRNGLGNITGYTLDEVREIPALAAGDLLAYLDEVCAALRARLLAMGPEALHQPSPGRGGKYTPTSGSRACCPAPSGMWGRLRRSRGYGDGVRKGKWCDKGFRVLTIDDHHSLRYQRAPHALRQALRQHQHAQAAIDDLPARYSAAKPGQLGHRGKYPAWP